MGFILLFLRLFLFPWCGNMLNQFHQHGRYADLKAIMQQAVIYFFYRFGSKADGYSGCRYDRILRHTIRRDKIRHGRGIEQVLMGRQGLFQVFLNMDIYVMDVLYVTSQFKAQLPINVVYRYVSSSQQQGMSRTSAHRAGTQHQNPSALKTAGHQFKADCKPLAGGSTVIGQTAGRQMKGDEALVIRH